MNVKVYRVTSLAFGALLLALVARPVIAQDQKGPDSLEELLQDPNASADTPAAANSPTDENARSEGSGAKAGPTASADVAVPDAATAPTPVPQAPEHQSAPVANSSAGQVAPTIAVLPKASARDTKQIEEIVVTVQRREESLTNVPVSVSVLNQAQIANANITNASDLALYVPSLKANTLFGSENASFAIRGFVQDVRTTPSVATYFADVVEPRGSTLYTSGNGAGPGEMFDLMNVQVLKGPQGTLFGRNSTGGAVLLVPHRPQDEFSGHIETSMGDYGLMREEVVANVPVSDSFKFRVGIDKQSRDGYLANVAPFGTSKLANVDYTAIRLSTDWKISDTLDNYTVLSHSNSDTNNYAPKLFSCNDNYLSAILNNTLNSLPGLPPFAAANPLLVFIVPACQKQLDQQKASGKNGPYDIASAVAHPRSLIKQDRIINELTWSITDEVNLKSILSYARLFTKAEQSVFGSNFQVSFDPAANRRFEVATASMSPLFPTTNQDTRTAELQIQGNSFDSKLEWQGGLYFESSVPNGISGFRSPSLISCDPTTLSGDATKADCIDPTAGLLGSILDLAAATTYTSYAAFEQTTYNFSDALGLTLGLRYTSDTTSAYGKKIRYNFLATVAQTPITTITTPEVKSKKPTGTINLSYKPFDNSLAYMKYSRGYRQGGVNTQAEPGLDTYKEETVNSYELGFKFESDAWLPIRFSSAIFYNDFSNMQLKAAYVSQQSGEVPTIFNAGKSRLEGAELEGTVVLSENVAMNISYSHLKTKLLSEQNYQDKVLAVAGVFGAATYTPTADVGDPLPYSPAHNAVVGLSYHLPVSSDWGEILLTALYSYTSKQQVAATSASPYAVLDSFSLLNLNANWSGILGTTFDFAFFCTNVLNEKYYTYIQGGYNSLGFESGSTGQPLMVGARLKYSFK